MPFDLNTLVHCGSHQHPDMYKTLVLLKLNLIDDSALYFIVEAVAQIDLDQPDDSYFYDEHTCPTNYIPIEAVFTKDDDDPHGCFEYERSVWMPKDYEAAKKDGRGDEILRELFPETRF